MILHTIVAHETIFEEEHNPQVLEVARGEMKLLVTPMDSGRAQILRVISSNPNDYLRPEYQPGQPIDLVRADIAQASNDWEEEL